MWQLNLESMEVNNALWTEIFVHAFPIANIFKRCTTSVTWKSVRGRFGGCTCLPEDYSYIPIQSWNWMWMHECSSGRQVHPRRRWKNSARLRRWLALMHEISSGSFHRIGVEVKSSVFAHLWPFLWRWKKTARTDVKKLTGRRPLTT